MKFHKTASKVSDADMRAVIKYLDGILAEIDSTPHSNDGIELFNINEVKELLENESSRSTLKPRLEAMLEEGNWRPLAKVTNKTLNAVDRLRQKFPNFSEVINLYQKTLNLALLSKPNSIYVPPTLLIGDPGIGKTRFLKELASTLEVDFFQVDLATASAGFVLAGSSASWADGRPGMVSNSMRKSKQANPIILLDEIDKVSGDNRYDPIGCMYTMLERQSAKMFQDECLQVNMDCSAINWIASANRIETIPAPILSRFNVYHIDSPSHEQMSLVAQSVYSDLLNENSWGVLFESTLPEVLIARLLELSPREQKRALYNACGEAAFKHKNTKAEITLTVDDIVLIGTKEKKRAIGFY